MSWNHNTYYQRLLLRQLPEQCDRVLDVGCGAGAFAARLARTVGHVDAVDKSEAMIEAARRRRAGNVTWRCADVLDVDLTPGGYDAVVSITALHHLPLDDALRHLAQAIRPGGVLAAVVLAASDLPRELPVEAAASVANLGYGAAFAALRATTGRDWYDRDATYAAMPKVFDAPLTTRQARAVVAATLPGPRVKRLLFWRYLLVWRP